MKISGLILSCIILLSLSTCRASETPNIIIIFTDDWGYGDLGAHNYLTDVKTPNLDALSKSGILFSDAYITAPQCSPSRAGLLTGRYQQRFGFDSIPDGPLPLQESTIADRLQKVGYKTGMVGKWHLEPNAVCFRWARENYPQKIINKRVHVNHAMSKPYWTQNRGFTEFFQGELKNYWCNFDLKGNNLNSSGQWLKDDRFRVDVQTEAGLAFIERNADKKFFLYLAHYAPHVPLEATEKYLKRFPGTMPERRRTGLAMMSAVDDGVGRIMKLLHKKNIADNTLVMFSSDNGAPLGAHTGEQMADILPVGKAGPAWDGSRNDPLKGEKGMLAEGGIRVPMIWSWPAKLPKGKIIHEPVISLDMTASALAAGNVNTDKNPKIDGENLIPWLSGKTNTKPQRNLYWRFWNQAAIRNEIWKYMVYGDGTEFLFNIRDDKEETKNLRSKNKKIADRLKNQLQQWTETLKPAGLPSKPLNIQERGWKKHYFESHEYKSNN